MRKYEGVNFEMEKLINESSSVIDSMGEEVFEKNEINPIFNNEIWARIRKRAASQGVPIHGHFELTPICNFDCKMCYVHLQKEQMCGRKELSLDEWKRIIDQAIDAGMIFASLSGGECMISPYFNEIYTYLHSKGIIITLLTNGYLLDKKMRLLKKYPPAYIQVSIYGNSEEQYAEVTGKRCYNKVKSNVECAIENGLPVGIAVTTSKYLKNVSDIIKFYKQKNISVAVSQWLMPPYSSTGRILADFNLSKEEQVEISKDLWILNGNEKLVPYEGVLPKENTIGEESQQIGITCAAGRSDFSISWSGGMSMCVALNEPIGYPLKEGFEVVWKKTNTCAKTFSMPTECKGCVYHKICNHCPAQHLISAKKGHCNRDICEETKLMVKAGLLKI